VHRPCALQGQPQGLGSTSLQFSRPRLRTAEDKGRAGREGRPQTNRRRFPRRLTCPAVDEPPVGPAGTDAGPGSSANARTQRAEAAKPGSARRQQAGRAAQQQTFHTHRTSKPGAFSAAAASFPPQCRGLEAPFHVGSHRIVCIMTPKLSRTAMQISVAQVVAVGLWRANAAAWPCL
jgi:hypothetical protein